MQDYDMELTMQAPVQEPERQYYFIEEAKKLIAEKSRMLGRPLTFCVTTFGCQMNARDSEKLTGILEQIGYVEAEEEQADFVIYNTCTVRENANLRVYGRLGYLHSLKKKNPHMMIGLCGCMMQEPQVVEKLKKSYSFVNLIFGTHNIYKFAELVVSALRSDRMVIDIWKDTDKIVEDLPSQRKFPFKSGVNIMFGCNNFCSYCIVPYVRGRERSREKSLILDEARQMISAGYKDITLLGQNVNSYGKTLADKPTFAQLLHEIDSIDGDYWLRFMTSHPKDCSKELIDTIANGTHISKHLHLPFQSGSDRILKAMNRHYDRKKYLDIVNYAKEKIDGVSLTSDIIVGFPGETYEDFKETLSLIREVEFTSLFTFIYSPRVGTPAAKMDDPISAEEKSKWFRELLDVQEEIAAKRCASMVNNTEKVLIESETGKNGELNGRTSGNIIVELKGDKSLIGTFQNVKITQARNWILKGELV